MSTTNRVQGTETRPATEPTVRLSNKSFVIIGLGFTLMQAFIIPAVIALAAAQSRDVARDEIRESMPAIRAAAGHAADERIAAATHGIRRELEIRHEAVMGAIRQLSKENR